MIYHRVCNKINTTGANSGTGTAYPSGAPEITPGISGVRVTRSLVFCLCFVDRCLSFVLFLLAIVLSVTLHDLRILIKPLISSNSIKMIMMSVLYYTNTLSWIFTLLAHWNNSQWIDMSPDSDTLSRFSLFSYSLMMCA